jgi:hypothetical protein
MRAAGTQILIGSIRERFRVHPGNRPYAGGVEISVLSVQRNAIARKLYF